MCSSTESPGSSGDIPFLSDRPYCLLHASYQIKAQHTAQASPGIGQTIIKFLKAMYMVLTVSVPLTLPGLFNRPGVAWAVLQSPP